MVFGRKGICRMFDISAVGIKAIVLAVLTLKAERTATVQQLLTGELYGSLSVLSILIVI